MRKGAHWQPKDPKVCLIDDLQEIVERRTGSKLTRPENLNRTDAQRLVLALQTSDGQAALNQWRERQAEKNKHRYTVEKQADGTWAIFHGGGLIRVGFHSESKAIYEAKCMVIADREAGVPVQMDVKESR